MNRFCSLPEFLTAEAGLAAWRKRELRWCITGTLPGLTLDQQALVYQTAWGWWMGVCGIRAVRVNDARQADIRMGAGQIDGSGKTLAWSELPNGSDGPLRQMYDTGERWSAALVRRDLTNGFIPLVVTSAHEIGHALGLGHSQDEQALMYPSLNLDAWKPQAWDIREVLARYGAPAPRKPDDTPTPTTPQEALVLRLFPDLKVCELPAGWTGRSVS